VTDRGNASLQHRSRRAGFALLAVVWGVGLIAAMVVAFMTSSRLRLQAASNVAYSVAANYIAEAAINLTTLMLLARQNITEAQSANSSYDGAPRFCVFDGAAVAIAIEDEGGKIDLNTAPPEVMQALLVGLGFDELAAKGITHAIVEFRTAPLAVGNDMSPLTQSGKPIPPKRALFETVMELDQVGSVDPGLYRLLTRFVTVASRSPGVDPRAAPPSLFAALAGYPAEDVRRLTATPFPNSLNRKDMRFPANLNQMSERSAYLIHAEALLATGQTASREALLDLRPASGKTFAFREWRRGNPTYLDQLRAIIAANGAGVRDC
jgi:general secretion pathway protein K